ncbi:hypothetical protein C0Q70_08997 [Pomacea canaliculata]|uniref:Calcineurin-like phosphoesterase domain-containing protein n=1 Tax=Pomacea canaliculata TaxID=400727 RepID=A0A2T7P8K5_POMCA|nr:hypothetical protein C0Q70_08997 [Pomacea canaliculata]
MSGNLKTPETISRDKRCSYGDSHTHVFLPVLELEDLPSRQALRGKARCRNTSAASGGGASVSRRERIVGPTASSLPLAVTHTYSDTHSNMLQLPCLAAVVVTLMASCASGDTGYFWHVTDFHYDFTYWDHQLSCNNNVTNPGPLGDYWCDSPWRLVTDTIAAMGDIKSDVDFLIWTGDTVAHIEDEHLNVSLNMEIMQNLTDALDSGFPNKTIYATFGNHDYHPTNQFPATGSEIYNRTAEMWKKWIQEEEQMNNFRKGGYYTKSIWPNLRIVGLNTNLYYTSDKVTVNIPDPTGQLAWLSQTLQNAKNKTEKVIVTAHIPPGVHTPSRVVWFQEAFVAPFMTIISNFSDIIVGMHFGHDHHDGFKVFYDSQGQPAVPLFVAPSVTPWRYKLKTGEIGPPHNPAVRLVSFDRTSGKHLNIQQYRLDLPQGNLQKKANFTLLYNFTQIHHR